MINNDINDKIQMRMGESKLTKSELIKACIKPKTDWCVLSLKFMELTINLTYQRISHTG